MVDVCSLQSGAAGAEPAGSDDVEDFTAQYGPRGLDTFTVGASTYTVVTNFCGSGCQIIDLTDLGQAASVLEADAPWLATVTLPKRVAICFGTESTGVSKEMLASCDRSVYLPMHGFSDSLNVGVAAALVLGQLQSLLGAAGDYLTDGWAPEPADVLRARWARTLSRDDDDLQRMEKALRGEVAPLDDLRRPDEFRGHTGRPTRSTRRRDAKREEASETEI